MPVLTTVPALPRLVGRAHVDLRRQASALCSG
ncbi:putative leader peptide [Streptomyces sp. 6N223]